MNRNKSTWLLFSLIFHFFTIPSIADVLPVVFFENGASFTPQEREQIRSQVPEAFATSSFDAQSSDIVTNAVRKEDMDNLLTLFKEAQNAYFDGEFAAATMKFAALESKVRASMPSVTFQNRLREMHRDVLIFLSMLFKEQHDTRRYDKQLHQIVEEYPDATVSNQLFPPWIRDAVELQKTRSPIQKQTVRIDNATDCSIRVDGRIQDNTQSPLQLTYGTHTIAVECQSGRQSLTSVLHTADEPVHWTPFFISPLTASYLDNTITFHSNDQMSTNAASAFFTRFANECNQTRLLIAMKTREHISGFILDGKSGHITHQYEPSHASSDAPDIDLSGLFASLPTAHPSPFLPIQKKKWFQAPLPWILCGAGAALSIAGLSMGMTRGSPSKQEPAIWMMQLTGASLAASGIVLFFFPAYEDQKNTLALSAGAQFTF